MRLLIPTATHPLRVDPQGTSASLCILPRESPRCIAPAGTSILGGVFVRHPKLKMTFPKRADTIALATLVGRASNPAAIAAVCLLALTLLACEREAPNSLATTHSADPVKGAQQFTVACATCHGPDARGVMGLGKPLRASRSVQTLSDSELIAVITDGRSAGDPLNTTGIAMLPKGGNPALTQSDIRNIVAYLRTLQ